MSRNGSLGRWPLAFVFWAAFLLVLEPGNVTNAAALGRELAIEREAARIVVAALIGTAFMPALLYVMHRYPVSGLRKDFGNVAWLLLALLAIAGWMNIVSSFVAAWGFAGNWLPSGGAVQRQLVGNWALLTFALIGLSAIVRVIPASESRATRSADEPQGRDPPLREIMVRTGTRRVRVDLNDVDWIEAQGNYVALHVGDHTHLHRQALKSFAPRLDEARFVRIHRSTVIALDRVQEMRSDGEGEAMVRLSTGKELRVSKSYRRVVRGHWVAGIRQP